MVRAGCVGIRSLVEANPGKEFAVRCADEWARLVREEVPGAEVLHEQV